ncbi:Lys-gingipain precursor [Anatilimnocola aggregata]|uniref:Lys-gingipain n=1 Tax=Anatilimnocola aggregata TaxID=2528021 RepID=A0A517Y8D3_9BACT|nr:C25 family cysteine peptidase [Anatilimnocola aggregata]QDU26508.1 Lys-gingipain precursor [Anatilimnocola aggregata]
MTAWMLLCLTLAAETAPTPPAPTDDAPDAVVVAPKSFIPALDPLLAHRYAQGHRFVYIPNTWTPTEIRNGIRQAAKKGNLKYILLVGDAEPTLGTSDLIRQRCVPTHYATAKVNVKFGSEPEIATDNWYADLDDDELPDVAIGRIPADTPQQLSAVIAKILAYEKSVDHGLWRQRINFVAGVGGFGGVVDSMIESTTRKFLTDGIPASYTTNMTYGSWRSPFCPDPRRFHEVSLQQHNDGCLFWVYIGHGQNTALDRVAVPGARFHILDVNDGPKLKCENRAPIAIMLACYTAAFDGEQDCLAETMLHSPGGPVAIYGGTRVTMPYAMAVMGSAMMEQYFKVQPTTLGEAILNAKLQMVKPIDEANPLKNTNRLLLDAMASVMSPARQQMTDERKEHVHLFNLIGDPMTKLAHPTKVKLTVPRDAEPGQTITVSGESTIGGSAVVELCCRRDRFKTDLPQRDHFNPSNAGLASLHPVYEQANDRCWTRLQLPVTAGPFTTDLTIPAECHGACHVRVFVQGEQSHSLGAANVYVKPIKLVENREPISAGR